jgi:peptidoglycan/LPS O-acetylase OafA/YrhL
MSDYWLSGFWEYADCIASGAALALLIFMNAHKYLEFISKKIVIVSLFIVTTIIWILKHNFLLGIITVPFYNLTFALLATGLVYNSITSEKKWISILLSNPGIIYVGKLSFSIYLWQQVFLVPAHQKPLTNDLKISFLMIAVLSLFSYYCVEKPFLELKSKIRL